MLIRKANAVWEGTLKEGNGRMRLGSGAWEGPYSFDSRFANGVGTNPEELIGAAHAGCFSMALSGTLVQAGTPATVIRTSGRRSGSSDAGGLPIKSIKLVTRASCRHERGRFPGSGRGCQKNCPVSKALAGGVISRSTPRFSKNAAEA